MLSNKAFLMGFVLFLGTGCGDKTKISPSCSLQKHEDSYMLVTNWEFVQDTVFRVAKIGKSGNWIYVYGEHGKPEKCWVHIDDGVVVKIHEKCGQDEHSFYGRKNAVFYSPHTFAGNQ